MSPARTGRSMCAVSFDRHGGPEVLRCGEWPRPEPRRGELLIEVHAAGVNPRDAMLVAGTYVGRRLVGSPPIVPGSDVSGVIVALGPGVTGFSVGDAVVGMAPSRSRMGAFAEYITLGTAHVAHMPEGVGHLQAAALPCAGLTAWQSLFEIAKVGAGTALSVIGAAGGVGHYATQLGRWAGADVSAVCGPGNLDFVAGLGADRAIDYRVEDPAAVLADQEVILDCTGRFSEAALVPTLEHHGVHITTVPTPALLLTGWLSRLSAGPRMAAVVVRSRQADLSALLALMAAGDLRSEIAEVFPLADAAGALERIARAHTRGKLVLAIRDEAGAPAR